MFQMILQQMLMRSFLIELLFSTIPFLIVLDFRRKPVWLLLQIPIHLAASVFLSDWALFHLGTLPCFLTALICLTVFLHTTLHLSWLHAVYCTSCASALQHLAYSIDLILYPVPEASSVNKLNAGYFLIFSLIYIIGYYLFAKQITRNGRFILGTRSNAYFAALVVLVSIFLESWAQNSSAESFSLYQICLCSESICLLLLLYTEYSRCLQHDREQAFYISQQQWREQKIHYQASKEAMDLINRKCHDLKYQLAALENAGTSKEAQKELETIRSSISLYDAIDASGPDAVGTILTKKRLECESKGILLTSMLNGSILSFMDVVDLYTLLGNALDNAIEAVSKLTEPEKKVISVTGNIQAGLIWLCLENYTDQPSALKNGFPVSTKENDGFHGFGLRSIQAIAEKYNGSISVRSDGEIFRLTILLPANTHTDQAE